MNSSSGVPLQKTNRKRWIAALLFCVLATIPAAPAVAETGVPVDQLKRLFKRPSPPPIGLDVEHVALGERLFGEKMLSRDRTMSCASCHIPKLGFTDGRRTARGSDGKDLPRNTPALWNLSGARSFYWDGRAATLEAQIVDAIGREGEMAGTIDDGVRRLSGDPVYVAAFRRAFPGAGLSADNLVRAIAAYERSLASPDTRFDRWVAGDPGALGKRELAGLRIFTGKGRCLACHGGWRFTDDLFHDVGLPSADTGRSAIGGGTGRDFKTPSLREAARTAPYMHDGSLKSLDDVVAHYAGKLQRRGSLAPELKRGIALSRAERRDLVAFLTTLSSGASPPPKVPRN
jgi:cytochrome c peroxidase